MHSNSLFCDTWHVHLKLRQFFKNVLFTHVGGAVKSPILSNSFLLKFMDWNWTKALSTVGVFSLKYFKKYLILRATDGSIAVLLNWPRHGKALAVLHTCWKGECFSTREEKKSFSRSRLFFDDKQKIQTREVASFKWKKEEGEKKVWKGED